MTKEEARGQGMVERVADALFAAVTEGLGAVDMAQAAASVGREWDEEQSKEGMRVFARAAIEAMREPTDLMARAGESIAYCMDNSGGGCCCGECIAFSESPTLDNPSEVWSAMIDAALHEQTS